MSFALLVKLGKILAFPALGLSLVLPWFSKQVTSSEKETNQPQEENKKH